MRFGVSLKTALETFGFYVGLFSVAKLLGRLYPFFSLKSSVLGEDCLYFSLSYVEGIETRQLKISL